MHTHAHKFKQRCWGKSKGMGRRLFCCPLGHQTPNQKKWLWMVEHKSPPCTNKFHQETYSGLRQNWLCHYRQQQKSTHTIHDLDSCSINTHDTWSWVMFNQHTWYTILTHVQSTHMIHDLDSCSINTHNLDSCSINTHDTRSWLMFSQKSCPKLPTKLT